jgi:hypothetical protein
MSKLDKIINVFNKTITKLDKLVDSNRAKIDWNKDEINERQGAIEELTSESMKAQAISDKLKGLVS